MTPRWKVNCLCRGGKDLIEITSEGDFYLIFFERSFLIQKIVHSSI